MQGTLFRHIGRLPKDYIPITPENLASARLRDSLVGISKRNITEHHYSH